MEPWLSHLCDAAHRSIASVLDAGSCALLGYPNHTNPGDHAIWLGAKATLERLNIKIAYECSWKEYSRAALADAVASGAEIVFTGGGNFGDLWPATHALRERVLSDFPGVRLLQLPQSVHFQAADNLARTQELIRRHGNVVLLLRDEPSLAFAHRAFEADVGLCPDLSFACPIAPPADPPVADVVWVAREDCESRGLNPRETSSGVWRVDWNRRDAEREPLDGEAPLDPSVLALVERNRSLTKRATVTRDWHDLAQVRDQLTRFRLARGCRLLQRGRVIVTDSLHAHILALMLGIPSIATDNTYGKLRGTFDSFTYAAPLADWADTPVQALAVARGRLRASTR